MTMSSQPIVGQANTPPRTSTRLYYLDWLRVIAILAVFFYHAVHPFDMSDWHIKNVEQSMTVTVFLGLLFPWGMPFFFLIAGTGSWFALRKRTAREFAVERFKRLLVPFFAGWVLLWLPMLYLNWLNLVQRGVWTASYWDFVAIQRAGFTPVWFGRLGMHLWFLGFLFCFSVLGLPLFLWLRGESGQAFLARLVRICTRRGGILLFILPLLVVRFALQPLFPTEHDWADFFYLMTMFCLGYVLYTHEGFARAIRRDWAILLVLAILSTAAWAVLALTAEDLDVFAAPRTLRDFTMWGAITINSWCWSAFMLFIGMRFLDFTNKWLEYGQEAVLPFFVLHQPVIITIAFFVVQWNAGIPLKLVTVVLGSFVVTLGIYELIIRRVPLLRVLFGMKPAPKRAAAQPEAAPAGGSGAMPSP
jgi:peptidoglycan/LPS O-acetylase OafA/YrhL